MLFKIKYNLTFNYWNKKQIKANYMTTKYNEIYQSSIRNPEKFWKEISEDIFWFKKPTKILNFNYLTLPPETAAAQITRPNAILFMKSAKL